jgi:hypothetical protein
MSNYETYKKMVSRDRTISFIALTVSFVAVALVVFKPSLITFIFAWFMYIFSVYAAVMVQKGELAFMYLVTLSKLKEMISGGDTDEESNVDEERNNMNNEE